MKEKETDPLDLQKAAPRLSAVSKDNPFRVPGHYFEDLHQSIMLEARAREAGIENTEPLQTFTVPSGYFEQLPLTIQDRISEKKTALVRPLLRRPSFALSLAAAFIAVMLVTRPALWFGMKTNVDTGSITAEELSNSSYLSEMDEPVLIDAIESHEQPIAASKNSNTEVENYLIDNHIDMNLLTSEL